MPPGSNKLFRSVGKFKIGPKIVSCPSAKKLRNEAGFSCGQDREWEAFLLSAIVHVFLFTSVTFVFQPLELSIKPVFVFLGQIIGREEIAQLQTSDEQSLGNRNQPAFVLKDTPVRAEWVTLRQGQKDAYAGEIIHGQKLHIKNTFLNENQDAQKWKDEFNRMGIDPDLTPWTPLRLNK